MAANRIPGTADSATDLKHPLTRLRGGHDGQVQRGLFAVCSTHPFVLERSFRLAARTGGPILVEATANQVNSDGGYSGLTPAAFAALVRGLGRYHGVSEERILIGADHLGPHVWQNLPFTEAMSRAEKLARECVAAGFCKLHIDTVSGNASVFENTELTIRAAQQTAVLCRAAEETAKKIQLTPGRLYYVIGTDVPPPGGGLEKGGKVTVTSPDQLHRTIDLFEHAFIKAGLQGAWERVVAVVVQPGVEFGDEQICAYRTLHARRLSDYWHRLPGRMSYEIHATDYQRPAALQRLVRDHFNLLKTGPCLTFAVREVLYALAYIEQALPCVERRADLVNVMEEAMTRNPQHWHSHYQGSAEQLAYLRHYSLRDRIRYYWPQPRPREAVGQLLHNLKRVIPGALLHQFLPDLFPDPYTPTQSIDPHKIIGRRIDKVLSTYAAACGLLPRS